MGWMTPAPLSLKEEVVSRCNRGKLVAPIGYGEERINSSDRIMVREYDR